jgi:hypothetical protein
MIAAASSQHHAQSSADSERAARSQPCHDCATVGDFRVPDPTKAAPAQLSLSERTVKVLNSQLSELSDCSPPHMLVEAIEWRPVSGSRR